MECMQDNENFSIIINKKSPANCLPLLCVFLIQINEKIFKRHCKSTSLSSAPAPDGLLFTYSIVGVMFTSHY